MRSRPRGRWLATAAAVLLLGGGVARGDDAAELHELKDAVRAMQQTIDGLNKKIEKLEAQRREKAAAPAPTPPPTPRPRANPGTSSPRKGSVRRDRRRRRRRSSSRRRRSNEEAAEGHAENVISSQGIGPQAPVDPKLRGFFPVPYTKAMIRFNAKPRVDFTYDTQNAGDDNRFVTAKIPVLGDPNQGGGPVFNANSKGSQLMIDVRAPEMAGNPRFYYQNDFFGSGSGEFNYRVQQLYGSIYNVTVGQTFSPFEDPDIWPDTVDYEGPNSMIFARFPLVRYKLDLADGLGAQRRPVAGRHAGLGLQRRARERRRTTRRTSPSTCAASRPTSGTCSSAPSSATSAPRAQTFGTNSVFGWGLNLAGDSHLGLPWRDTSGDLLGGQLTYGEGIGRYGNDSGFFATDAAYNSQRRPRGPALLRRLRRLHAPLAARLALDGDLRLRATSTASPRRAPNAYHQTQLRQRQPHLADARAAQRRRRRRCTATTRRRAAHSGDVFRTQVGVAYSLF